MSSSYIFQKQLHKSVKNEDKYLEHFLIKIYGISTVQYAEKIKEYTLLYRSFITNIFVFLYM
jgi:hypothetical protein